MTKRKALVTGCAGFIGGHAAARLSVEGFDIVGVANDNTLTFDVGAGNFKDVIIVTDLAGNQNSSGAEVTVDNLAPVVSSVNKNSIKNGNTANITGSGFDIDIKNGSSFVDRNFRYTAVGFGRGS